MGLDMYLEGKNSDGSFTEVAYWRKANQIHKWFVDNVQNGIDKCQRSPVTRQQLSDLLVVCNAVIDSITLIDSYVYTGQHSGADTNYKLVDDYIEGQVIENPEVAEELLPTQGGFFFGSTAYDQFYVEGVKDTIEQLKKVLALEFKEFVYQSSW